MNQLVGSGLLRSIPIMRLFGAPSLVCRYIILPAEATYYNPVNFTSQWASIWLIEFTYIINVLQFVNDRGDFKFGSYSTSTYLIFQKSEVHHRFVTTSAWEYDQILTIICYFEITTVEYRLSCKKFIINYNGANFC